MGLIVLHLAVYYATTILLFDTTAGPLPSRSRWVQTTEFARPVDLFDWLRRLFGAYSTVTDSILGTVWKPTGLMDVWLCAYCLGFWVALLFVAGYVYLFPEYLRLSPFLVLSCAAVAGYLNRA